VPDPNSITVFFLAFLPQFTDPSRGLPLAQIVLLGSVFVLATILVFGSVSLLAGKLGGWLTRSTHAQRILNGVAGLVFTGLAIRLLLVEVYSGPVSRP